MTPEQIEWARKQFWFDSSGEDAEGVFVVGWDSWGSRNALLFRDFDKLREWAELQRDFTNNTVAGEQDEPEMTEVESLKPFVLTLVFGLGAFVPALYLVWGAGVPILIRLVGLVAAMAGFVIILRAWVFASVWRLQKAGTPAWWSLDKGAKAAQDNNEQPK